MQAAQQPQRSFGVPRGFSTQDEFGQVASPSDGMWESFVDGDCHVPGRGRRLILLGGESVLVRASARRAALPIMSPMVRPWIAHSESTMRWWAVRHCCARTSRTSWNLRERRENTVQRQLRKVRSRIDGDEGASTSDELMRRPLLWRAFELDRVSLVDAVQKWLGAREATEVVEKEREDARLHVLRRRGIVRRHEHVGHIP